MNEKNITLVHQLFLAVGILILVYSGEQVKTNHIEFFKYSYYCSGLAIVFVISSLIPGAIWDYYDKKRHTKIVVLKELAFTKPIVNGVRTDIVDGHQVFLGDPTPQRDKIEEQNEINFHKFDEQLDFWNKVNTGFVCIGLIPLAASIVFFIVGIYKIPIG